jgi:ArsR family transcriptional regulator, arsenate/arsenite/antimonite-responsive transcriptional repressor
MLPPMPESRRARSPKPAPDAGAVARCFHALSDETRLAILECLRGGEECVCHLTGALESAQSRLSFHLKVLKDAGLVRDRRDGRWIHYSIDREALDIVRNYIERLDSRRRKP